MIFLRDNVLVERDLKLEDVKPRLLGMPCPSLSDSTQLTAEQDIGALVRGSFSFGLISIYSFVVMRWT
jgi:hypothetical protein